MTVKQIIIGTLLGVTALGTTLHRVAKSPAQTDKPAAKSVIKTGARPAMRSESKTPRLSRARRKPKSPDIAVA